jgi:LmbE family N-acetylglucosaminyl deacetylase
MWIDPAAAFPGKILIAAPHMDDEVLACGGTIAALPDKRAVHIAYATDGSRSPVPSLRRLGAAAAELPSVRAQEARQALAALNVPETNLYFLDLPDGRLDECQPQLETALGELIARLRPAFVFVPFRHDRHPDHIALYQAARRALPAASQLVEYFVYYRWRLLPGGDLRAYIRPEALRRVDIRAHAQVKRQALACYRSQTTVYFDWQDRPILPAQRVAAVSQEPESFLVSDGNSAGGSVFARRRIWIRLMFQVEPRLKRVKEQALATARAAGAA